MTRIEKYKDLREKLQEENFKPLLNKDFYDLTRLSVITRANKLTDEDDGYELFDAKSKKILYITNETDYDLALDEFAEWLESPYEA